MCINLMFTISGSWMHATQIRPMNTILLQHCGPSALHALVNSSLHVTAYLHTLGCTLPSVHCIVIQKS